MLSLFIYAALATGQRERYERNTKGTPLHRKTSFLHGLRGCATPRSDRGYNQKIHPVRRTEGGACPGTGQAEKETTVACAHCHRSEDLWKSAVIEAGG